MAAARTMLDMGWPSSRRTRAWSRTHVARSAALSGALCAWTSGCSYLFVDAAPSRHAGLREFECTTSLLMPVADSGWAAVFTYAAFEGVLGAGERARGGELAVPVAGGVALTALAVASAAHGYLETDDCRRAKRALAHRSMEEGADSPGAYRER